MATNISPPMYSSDPCELTTFLEGLDVYFDAVEITSDKRKLALLKHLGGQKVQETLTLHLQSVAKEQEETDFNHAARVLKLQLLPAMNLTFQSFQFRSIKQLKDEQFENFVHRVTIAAQKCAFEDRDRQIKDQLIIGCDSETLKKVAIREDPDLTKLLTLGKSEDATRRTCDLMNVSEQFPSDQLFSVNTSRSSQKNRKCFNCGEPFPHGDQPCPARDSQCGYCKRHHHLESMCRTKKRRARESFSVNMQEEVNSIVSQASPPVAVTVDTDYNIDLHDSDDDWVFVQNVDSVYSLELNQQTAVLTDINHTDTDKPRVLSNRILISIDSCPVPFVPDTGATVTTIDFDSYIRLCQNKHYTLHRSNTRIFAYGSTEPIPLKGYFHARVSRGDKQTSSLTKIHVLRKRNCGNLLSRKTCTELGLISINYDENVDELNSLTSGTMPMPSQPSTEIRAILAKFPSGIGRLKDVELKLDIDKSVKPVIQKARRIPLHKRKAVEEKLAELQENDIIEPVSDDTATTWLSPIHIVDQNKLRLVVDMRVANTAIRRIRRPIPTVEEVIADMAGSKFFSKIDLNAAYHQILLAPESRDITSFSTHIGNFRYKTLMFGVSSACEEFNHRVSVLLSKVKKGVKNIHDDIVIYAETIEEHNVIVTQVLNILLDAGLTINREKCVFGVQKIEFFGLLITPEGTTPIIKDTLANIQRPNNKYEVRSFIGAVNFIGKFIPDFSTLLAPITDLLGKRDFIWEQSQEDAYQSLLKEIKSPRLLKHFDPTEPTEVTTDASPVGLSAILSQNEHPVLFISRKLSPVESRYGQTEREALAVVWALERLHFYLYGITFKVLSDHKPLEVLYAPTGKPSQRILRWALRLLPYSFQINHIAGVSNPADYFSRKPLGHIREDEETAESETEHYVNHTIMSCVPNSISLQELETESRNDKELELIRQNIMTNQWHKTSSLDPSYAKLSESLTCKNGIVLREDRIILPASLRSRTLKLLHSTHMGMSKTKEYARKKVWWPKIDNMIEEMVKACNVCQATTHEGGESLEPLRIKTTPVKPFSTVHIDLFGPLESGETLLGIVDELSRWPEVYVLPDRTRHQEVIKHLNKTFGRFGTPETLVSDNGPQFISWEFKNYLCQQGIRQHLITPYYPQANSTVERFFRTLKKFVKTCSMEKKQLSDELHKFLSVYRNTPIRATGKSPAELILRYQPGNLIPASSDVIGDQSDKNLREAISKNKEYKLKMKSSFDTPRNKPSTLETGDHVLVKNKSPTKSQPIYDPNPFVILRRKGNRLYLKRGRKYLTRPVHLCKKVPAEQPRSTFPQVTVSGNPIGLQMRHRRLQDNPAIVPNTPQPPVHPNDMGSGTSESSTPFSTPSSTPSRTSRSSPPSSNTPVSQDQSSSPRLDHQPTINRQQFRRNVFNGNETPLRYTSTGRLLRPVLGRRLIDEINQR